MLFFVGRVDGVLTRGTGETCHLPGLKVGRAHCWQVPFASRRTFQRLESRVQKAPMRLRSPTIILGRLIVSLLLGVLAAKAWVSSVPAAMTVTVTPSVTGEQLIRSSLPLPQGFLHEGQTLSIRSETLGRSGWRLHTVVAGVRALSWYPVTNGEPKSVRRALVTFPASFRTTEAEKLLLQPVASKKSRKRSLPVTVEIKGEAVALNWKSSQRVDLNLLAPARTSTESPRLEVVEANEFYLWQRWHFPDPQWPRIIELRC